MTKRVQAGNHLGHLLSAARGDEPPGRQARFTGVPAEARTGTRAHRSSSGARASARPLDQRHADGGRRSHAPRRSRAAVVAENTPGVGLEPTTNRLTADYSAIELPRIGQRRMRQPSGILFGIRRQRDEGRSSSAWQLAHRKAASRPSTLPISRLLEHPPIRPVEIPLDLAATPGKLAHIAVLAPARLLDLAVHPRQLQL
jgi:hypothetical protein